MTIAAITQTAPASARGAFSPVLGRAVFALAVGAGMVAGVLATGGDASSHAVAEAGAELARLLRFMAALKALMAAGLAAAILWRLGDTVTPGWLAAYALAGVAMAMGPGLIWGIDHVVPGALLLHGGLLAGMVLLWRDPVVATRLGQVTRLRRGARLR
jgi:hypothetical protein